MICYCNDAAKRRVAAERSLAEHLGALADGLAAMAKPGGQDMTQEEIDEMWGHP